MEDFDENDTEHNKYVKVNFPPFQHWKFNDADIIECVGKSHWKGDLEKGKFDKDAGQITKTVHLTNRNYTKDELYDSLKMSSLAAWTFFMKEKGL